MEDIRTAKALLNQGDYMASIDLKDAYFLIPIHKDHRKFLRFRFQNNLFQFTCLPFGLCTSPYIYTKIMKPVMNEMRTLGIMSIIYIDDLLLIHNSLQLAIINIQKAIRLLEWLGFVINYKKSSLVPNKRCKYLGFIIDSVNYNLELSDNKRLQINLCKSFQEGKYYKIREVARLLGILTAAGPAIAYSTIYCKRLKKQKFLSLLFNNNNYEEKMLISKHIKADFDWWQKNAKISSNPIRLNKFKT